MPKRVLLIDDDEVIRALARMGLELEGHEVLEAEDAEEGLRLARTESPDLVLLDGRLPGGMDGPDALRALRADPHTQGIPVVYLSAAEELSDAPDGATGFIAKPFDPVSLAQRVAQLVGWA